MPMVGAIRPSGEGRGTTCLVSILIVNCKTIITFQCIKNTATDKIKSLMPFTMPRSKCEVLNELIRESFLARQFNAAIFRYH